MATISLLIVRSERRDTQIARAFAGKQVFSFGWDKNLPSAQQYNTISQLVIDALKDSAPEFSITFDTSAIPLPEMYDSDGVVYLLKVVRKS